MKISSLMLAISLSSSATFADSLVSCKTTARTPVKVVEYVIKSTRSLRLNSPIFFTKNSVVITIEQSAVAQYGAGKKALYFLADDANEVPALRLHAVANRKMYTGNLDEFSAAGTIIKTTKVNCAISVL